HRFAEAFLDFEDELVRPIPALVCAAQDRAAVNRVEIDAVEAAAVHDFSVVGGDLGEERGVRVWSKQAETFLEVTRIRPLGVRDRLSAQRAAFEPGETPRRLL